MAVVHRARVMLSELARARDDVDALRAGASAVLRVGSPSVTAAMPAAIIALRARLPAASVQIREGRVRELVQRLLDGELDCVFGAITPEMLAGDELPLLHSETLIEDELCVLAADTNATARRRKLRWSDLHSAHWVAPPKETLVRQAFMTAFLNEGLEPPVPVIEAMSSVTIGAVLRMDTSLLCAMRFEQARDELSRGGVRRVAVQPTIPLPALSLLTRRSALEPPQVVQEFARAIRVTGAAGARAHHRRESRHQDS
jgi:DNA-binding transcriptional LysR family regulator